MTKTAPRARLPCLSRLAPSVDIIVPPSPPWRGFTSLRVTQPSSKHRTHWPSRALGEIQRSPPLELLSELDECIAGRVANKLRREPTALRGLLSKHAAASG